MKITSLSLDFKDTNSTEIFSFKLSKQTIKKAKRNNNLIAIWK